MAKRLVPDEDNDDYDLTEQFAREAEEAYSAQPPFTSENDGHNVVEVMSNVKIIPTQPPGILEKIKALGNDAVYVLQDLLLDPEVSDRVRLDAVKAVIAIVEAEKNKELTVVAEGAADLDELERLIRDGGFDL